MVQFSYVFGTEKLSVPSVLTNPKSVALSRAYTVSSILTNSYSPLDLKVKNPVPESNTWKTYLLMKISP